MRRRIDKLVGLSFEERMRPWFEKHGRELEQLRRSRFEESEKFRLFIDHHHPNKARDQVFECLIHEYLQTQYSEYFFALDKRLWSHDSQNLRQLDIVKYKKGRSNAELELVDIIECKDYARPIGSPIVEKFYGKLKGLRHYQGTIYSPRGFTKPATSSAAANGIALISMPWLDLLSSLWHSDKDFIACHSCSQEDYDFRPSNVTWNNADYDQLRIGHCLACGVTHLSCIICDQIFPCEYEAPYTLECPGGCDSLYYFGISGYGKERTEQPVEFIYPQMARALKFLKSKQVSVAYEAMRDLLQKAGYSRDLSDLFFTGREYSWIDEDDDGNYTLGYEGRKIVEEIQWP